MSSSRDSYATFSSSRSSNSGHATKDCAVPINLIYPSLSRDQSSATQSGSYPYHVSPHRLAACSIHHHGVIIIIPACVTQIEVPQIRHANLRDRRPKRNPPRHRVWRAWAMDGLDGLSKTATSPACVRARAPHRSYILCQSGYDYSKSICFRCPEDRSHVLIFVVFRTSLPTPPVRRACPLCESSRGGHGPRVAVGDYANLTCLRESVVWISYETDRLWRARQARSVCNYRDELRCHRRRSPRLTVRSQVSQ